MATDRAKELAQNTTFELNPESQPYKPGFWAVDYDPTQAQWTDTESELGGFNVDVQGPPDVEAVMPDIRARDLHTPPGPPGEADWRMRQQVPSILKQSPKYDKDVTPPVASALSDATDTSVEINKGQMSNWQVNAEKALQDMIKIEETDPTSRIQSLGGEYKPRFEFETPIKDLPQGAKWPKPPMEESQHDNKIGHLSYLASPSVDGNAWLEDDIKGVVNRRFEDTMPNANALLNSGIVERVKEKYKIYPTDLDPSTAYGPHGYIPENPETDPEFQKRGLISVSTSYHGGNPVYTGQDYRGRYDPDAGEISYDKRLTGNIDDKRRQENKKEWEKSWYGEEYGTSGRHTEAHEPVHEFFDILRNTADHWKHIKYDGKPLIDVIAPCKGNSTTCSNSDRLWDYAAEHVSVYTHSNIPSAYTRIIRWYGNKTVNGKSNENYVNIFDKADSHPSNEIDYAKFVIAAEFTSAIDQAAGAVLSAWETKDAHTPHKDKIPFKFGNNPIYKYRHKVVKGKKVALH